MMQFHWPGFDSLRKLSPEEATEFAARVAELTKAGLPLGAGLRALADELPGRRLPRVLHGLANRLDAGDDLVGALESQGRSLPAHLRGLMLAGVRSGRLAEVLEEYVDLQHSQSELRRRVWLALAYPFILLLFMTALAAFASVYVVDAFAEDIQGFRNQLACDDGGGHQRIAAGDVVLRGPGRPCRSWFRSCFGWRPRAGWVWPVLYRVPMVGPLLRWSHLAQFARLMGLLLEQQVSLPDALRLTAAGLRDANLARGCCRVADDTEKGRALDESMAAQAAVPGQLDPDDPVGPAGAGLARRLPCGRRDVRGPRALARHAAGDHAAADHVSGDFDLCRILRYRHVSAVDLLDYELSG